MAGSVYIRLEFHALLCDFSHLPQAENLETAAVCKNRLVPVHEFMKSTGLSHNVRSRSEIQVVCIAQDYLCTLSRNVFRLHGFYRGLGSHRHENRCLDSAVRRGNPASPGLGPAVCFDQLVA